MDVSHRCGHEMTVKPRIEPRHSGCRLPVEVGTSEDFLVVKLRL